MVAPVNAAYDVYRRIPGGKPISLSQEVVVFVYPCNAKFHVRLVFDGSGNYFGIAHDDFSLGQVNGAFAKYMSNQILADELDAAEQPMCVGAIVGANIDSSNQFVISLPFLKSWYSIFSYGDDFEPFPGTTLLGRGLHLLGRGNGKRSGPSVTFAAAVRA